MVISNRSQYQSKILAIPHYNRSQVQSSTFRVKDKEGIKDPKSSLKKLTFPNNCKFGYKFWIKPEKKLTLFS
jgi:hypothetical protein